MTEKLFVSLTFFAVGGGQLVQIAVQEALICRRRILDMSENSFGMGWVGTAGMMEWN